ncbi:Ephrin-B2 [Trichinella pseudospiralis]|uniref:Ephrin-B2 n=1 Tax=Trichinella pseudospiralis TaxID=6337 RepID=A0A0V1JTL2_TRIPS|nr:Ephrin-B2 [Trichinella pseudospiralis]
MATAPRHLVSDLGRTYLQHNVTNWHELPAAPCYDRHQHPRSCSRWDIKTSKPILQCSSIISHQSNYNITDVVVQWHRHGKLLFIIRSAKVITIFWNSSNPQFISTEPMEPFVVQLHDKVDLICPQYKRETLPNLLEFSIIYMVDKVGYESCSINSTARLVGLCTVPYKKQVVTVVFRRFTPNPGGLEFVPNRRYYLITTSTGKMEGMQNTNRGLCYSKNMRLQFDVKEENYQPVESSKNKLDINRTSTKPFIIWDQPNHRAGENSRFTPETNFAHNNLVGNDVHWPNSRFTAPKHRANAYRPARLTERLNDQNQQNNNGRSKASVCSGRLQSLHLHLFALSLFLIISLTCLN